MPEAALKKTLPVESPAPRKTPMGSASPRPLWSLRREMERILETLDHGMQMSPFSLSSLFDNGWQTDLDFAVFPAVDVVDKGPNYEITAELPGLEEKDVKVKLENTVLTISGEKQDDKEQKKKGYFLRERSYGSFMRSFRVPEDVEAGKIDAHFRKGVLTIVLPKKTEAKKSSRTIAVKSGG